MQIKTEQIDDYPAPSVDPTAAIAAELDVAREVLVAQAGRLQVHEQHARILQANYDRLMAFVGDQVGQLRGVAGEFELRAEHVRDAVATRDRLVATDRATEVAKAWESQIHEKYAKILQANNDRLVSFVEDLTDRLRGVASELELRVGDVRAALAAKDKAGARDPKVRKCAEARAAKEASLVRSLQSAELEHAERMKAAQAAHAESLKALTERLRAAEEAHANQIKAVAGAHADSLKALDERLRAAEQVHARQTKAAEASHAESLTALTERMRAAEQVHSDKLKGVEHAYAYNLKAVAHINAERLEALEKAHAGTLQALKDKLSAEEEARAETLKVLEEKLRCEEEAHAETLKVLEDKLRSEEEAHAETLETLKHKLRAEEKAHAETLEALKDKLSAADEPQAEERGPEPRPSQREEEDVIDALSKTFEFAPPFSSMEECKKSGFLVKPSVIKQVLTDLKKQGSLTGMSKTGLLARLEQRGYPQSCNKIRFDPGIGKQQLTLWVVGVKLRPAAYRDLGAWKRRRPGKRERQAQRLMALNGAHAESIMPQAEGLVASEETHAESLRARDEAHAESLRAREEAHAESLRARDEAHAESLRARDEAHAESEALLTEKLRSAEEAVQTKAAVLKRLFRASRGLLEVHLGTVMDPEGVASCMAMTEPAKDRSAGKRKRLEFSKTDDCIEESAPKLIEWKSPQLIDRNEVVQHSDAIVPYCEDTNTFSVACATRSRTIVPPMRSKRLRAVV